jgi:hypothetical protein
MAFVVSNGGELHAPLLAARPPPSSSRANGAAHGTVALFSAVVLKRTHAKTDFKLWTDLRYAAFRTITFSL